MEKTELENSAPELADAMVELETAPPAVEEPPADDPAREEPPATETPAGEPPPPEPVAPEELGIEVRQQAPSLKNAVIYAAPSEEGSWKMVALVASTTFALGTAQGNSVLGHLLFSMYDYVISESLGFHLDYNKSLGQQYEELQETQGCSFFAIGHGSLADAPNRSFKAAMKVTRR